MSEWLDLMLDEIRRKEQERREAAEERARREQAGDAATEPSKEKAS